MIYKFFLILIVIGSSACADWPMGRADSAGTGATAESLPDGLELLWEVENEGLGYDAGPIIADGMVFAADADGEVIALRLDSGEQVWKVAFETGFMASPAYQAGVVYVGDYDGTLRALDAKTGQENWKYAAELEIDGSPNFFEKSVLFTSQSGSLYSLKTADGSLGWKYETGDQLQCGATLAGNRTFLGGCDGYLHIVDVQTGKSVREPIPIDGPTGSTPSVVDLVEGETREQLVLVPTYAGEIIAFRNSNYEEAWRFKDESLSSEFKNSVAISEGMIVATSRNKKVFALNARTGELVWNQTLRKRSDASPVIAGGQVVVAAADGRILLFDLKSGKEKWMFEVKGGFLGSPAVADGKVVVCSDRGTIYCLGAKQNITNEEVK
ncbi:MAG: PQQ-binding-like beta-propeller repeat protein [Pirellulaceae bacterium]